MRRRRSRIASVLLELTQLGHLQWFCGNLYETIVKVPDLQARHRERRGGQEGMSPLRQGSPVRYYAVAAPAVLPALFAAASVGWYQRSSRPWLTTAVACSSFNVALTAHLVRTVNLKLFFRGEPTAAADAKDMLATWYRLNAVRLVLTGVAWLAVRRARHMLTQ